jgi:hypothetical protein
VSILRAERVECKKTSGSILHSEDRSTLLRNISNNLLGYTASYSRRIESRFLCSHTDILVTIK